MYFCRLQKPLSVAKLRLNLLSVTIGHAYKAYFAGRSDIGRLFPGNRFPLVITLVKHEIIIRHDLGWSIFNYGWSQDTSLQFFVCLIRIKLD
jgi:hypothetical protein